MDRLFREPGFARGHVVDFIAYWHVFVGNVADIAIVVAAVMIVILAATGVHIDGTRDARDATGDRRRDDDGRRAGRRSPTDGRSPSPTRATTEQNA